MSKEQEEREEDVLVGVGGVAFVGYAVGVDVGEGEVGVCAGEGLGCGGLARD